MLGIYDYIPERNHISRVYIGTAILWVQCIIHAVLLPITRIIHAVLLPVTRIIHAVLLPVTNVLYMQCYCLL